MTRFTSTVETSRPSSIAPAPSTANHQRSLSPKKGGQPDVADEVGLPEPVEALRAGAREERDADEEEHERAPPDEPSPVAGDAQTGAAAARARAELRLGHQRNRDQADRERERSVGDHGALEAHGAEPDPEHQADERRRVGHLHPAHEHPPDVLGADLVRDPGLVGAAHERPAEPPEHPAEEDGPELGHRSDEDRRAAHHEQRDHDGQLAPVQVGDDSGRHLEQEDGRLHHRADEHELKRAQPHLLHEVDRDHDEARQRERALGEEVEVVRARAPHGWSGPLTESEASRSR